MARQIKQFFFEVTDTYGGEPNYAWVRRYMVRASSILGAVRKLSREMGLRGRLIKEYAVDYLHSWKVRGAAMCVMGQWSDGQELETYLHVKTI